MKTDGTINLIGCIKNKANDFIMQELKKAGFTDIVPSHGHILLTLYKYGECTMTDLSSSIQKDRSTVTSLVNKLIKLGYISSKKDIDDSRVTIVFLTEKGREFESVFQSISKDLYEMIYKGFEDEEKEVLMRLLIRIYNNFNWI